MMEKQKITKAILPHAIAVAIMFILPLLYATPVMKGYILYQNDIIQGGGASSELIEYREKNGEEALWTGTMFSGMPTFQMAIVHSKNLGYHINKLFRRMISGPLSVVFICMLGAYILFVSLKINPYISLICAIGFGFSTFNMVSLEAGHNSKINALGYFPAVLGGVILAYRGKIWLGSAITALFLNLHLVANHFQITYYLIFAILFYILIVLYKAIREKTYKNFINASALLLVAAILAAVPNTSRLWTTYEYANETIRGGKSELTKPEADAKSTGLDKDYAQSWSYGVMESLTTIIPYFNGGASNETLDRNSNLAKAGLPRQYLDQVPTYWGDQPFTSGPVYLGAIYCFLFVLAIMLLKGPLRWWLIAYSLFALILSWGKNFAFLNDFLFYNLPLYNKFRTPSMFLGVLQITFPFAAALVLQKIVDMKENSAELIKKLLYAAGIVGGIVFLFGLLLSAGYSFTGENDARLASAGYPMEALKDDRADLLRGDAIRSLILISLATALIYFFLKNKIREMVLYISLGVIMLGDLWLVDKRYLNDDNFESPRKIENLKTPSTADLQIMEDKDLSYRVFNLTRSPFNDAITSYHHKSIGGYHAGKLYRYQELIERHLSKNNMKVLNMLNTKYFIVADQQNGNRPVVRQNPGALGNAWVVENISWVKNADAEMNRLSDFNPASEVLIDERYRNYIDGKSISKSESDEIRLSEYSPNKMTYSANIASENAFVVFSEIYYAGSSDDWKVYLDGEEVDHIRVNYLLRGMLLPRGEHEIVFEFKPRSWVVGSRISLYGSILLALFVVGGIFMNVRSSKGEENDTKSIED